MPSYTLNSIASAYLDVTDNGLSVRRAAQKHGIPYQTLSDRLKGIIERDEVIQPNQRLLPSQEETIVKWIIRQERLSYAPTHS